MKTFEVEETARLLGPLLTILRAGRHLRLVARPGLIMADRPEGSETIAANWESAWHAEVIGKLREPVQLEDGCIVEVIGEALVLRRPPDPLRRLDDLVRENRISSLAGRMLSATVGLGYNLLVAGPYAATVELIAAIIAEGRRPAVVGGAGDAVPPAWVRLESPQAAVAYGADRVGAWSLPADEIVSLFGRVNGAVALIEARRMDRALVRYEAAAERLSSGRGSTPLAVIAGVDFLVVVTSEGGPRVREVAEIVLAEEGYRPRLLFASGLQPVTSALVPVAEPGCLEELSRAGHGVLVDELRHATHGMVEATPAPRSRPTPDPAMVTISTPRPVTARPAVPVVEPAPPSPRFDPALVDAPPPGWELDRLPEETTDPGAGAGRSPEDATLAATFGLGPPPAPPGILPMSAETLAGGENTTFADALKRAKLRDLELAADDEGDDTRR